MEQILVTTLSQSLIDALGAVAKLALILIPLMVVVEVMRHYGVFQLLTTILSYPLRRLGISGTATFSLIVGLIVGLTYGSGTLIQNRRNGQLSRKDVFVTSNVLAVCHSIIEDSLIFIAIGASLTWLVSAKLVVGVIVLLLASASYRYFSNSSEPDAKIQLENPKPEELP